MLNLRPQVLRLDELNVNAAIAGRGPLVLFLHGFGASWQWWQPNIAALCDHFSVCAVDLPGWGNSSPLTSNTLPRAEFYREYVARILEHLSLGPALVVGHSLGGYVAAQAAIQDTPGIRALALVAPAGFGPVHNKLLRLLSMPFVGEFLLLSGHPGRRAFLRSLVYSRHSVSGDMMHLGALAPAERDQFLDQLRTGIHLGHTSEALLFQKRSPLTMPTLLVWGRHDSVFPLYQAYRAETMLGIRSPVVLDRSGHLPQLEEPDRFNFILRSFARWAHTEGFNRSTG